MSSGEGRCRCPGSFEIWGSHRKNSPSYDSLKVLAYFVEKERLKEEKLKQLDLQQRKLRDQDYQNLSDEISTQLKDLDIKSTTKN